MSNIPNMTDDDIRSFSRKLNEFTDDYLRIRSKEALVRENETLKAELRLYKKKTRKRINNLQSCLDTESDNNRASRKELDELTQSLNRWKKQCSDLNERFDAIKKENAYFLSIIDKTSDDPIFNARNQYLRDRLKAMEKEKAEKENAEASKKAFYDKYHGPCPFRNVKESGGGQGFIRCPGRGCGCTRKWDY